MRDRKLATRYARALLATLPDDRSAERVEAFLDALSDALGKSNDLRDVLLNLAVPRSARKAVLCTLAEQHGMPDQAKSFLKVVVDHGRTGHLPSMAVLFGEERERAAGIVPVTLETAKPLAESLRRRVRSALEKLTGRKVRLQLAVDEGHLGGAVARVGSKVYDGSLKTQLDILRRRMS